LIKKGRGAYLDPLVKTKLDAGELSLLKAMMKIPIAALPSSAWAEKMTLPEHIISGFLSNLKGLDLIKSTSDGTMLTEEEIKIADETGISAFWIGGEGQPLYKRADHVIDSMGSLDKIIKGYYQFDFPLWPNRPEKIVTLRGSLTDVRDKQIILHFNIDEAKMLKLIDLSTQKEVLVSIESM
jgi:hypothetical protein